MTIPASPHPTLHRHEFVSLIAAIMAVNALGVDLMLPALPVMGRDLGIATANARQWIVTAYIFGFAVGQLVYGPLADRFGRKPVLLATLAGFVLASVFAASAQTFAALIGARILQGAMSASTRVLSVAIVRDSYSGRRMAKTMSLAQMVFFLVPILAPTLGQGLLMFGPWRFIFYALAVFAATICVWSALRLPETLPREARREISFMTLAAAYRLTLTNRFSIGYTVAGALTFGGIIAFVSSSEQVFVDTFHQGARFALLFGLCALAMGFASFANSRLVERLGTRLISHSSIFGLVGLSVIHLLIARSGSETLWTYVIIQSLSLACIGLCGANFGAMAMAPVGHVAGTASSVQGFISSLGAVAVGSAIGQSYDGTTYPLAVGYLSIGLGALAIISLVEGGRLFRGRLLQD
ncbi:multidrug effflux MFS transporter [Sphingobium sp. H39-3-25]|uniref:multidrug effflux MFS transporter n=1 Tax=Sphingobium arseniciresistens TaxID=3030834 RepID=UPI0023B9BE45|nr:multidrug effflux MFS transporter [Sphingobium arseniciresistens]